MGIKWSKTAELAATPCKTSKIYPEAQFTNDPRSPTVFCRTPMQSLKTTVISNSVTKIQDLSDPSTPLKNTAANIFKRKMLRNSFDPRSPSVAIDRTPIVFVDENDVDNNITLDAENDTHISDVQISIIQEISHSLKETTIDETKPTLPLLDKNPLNKLIKSEEVDPRSPTVGIERTPIIFKAEIAEEILIMAESVVVAKDDPILVVAKVKEDLMSVQNATFKPINNFIFEDGANIKFSTPKKNTQHSAGVEEQQRTPLSCLANKKNGKGKVHKILAENMFKSSENNLKIFMDEQENENTPVVSNKLQNSAAMALSAKSKIPVFNRVNQ